MAAACLLGSCESLMRELGLDLCIGSRGGGGA